MFHSSRTNHETSPRLVTSLLSRPVGETPRGFKSRPRRQTRQTPIHIPIRYEILRHES